MRISAHRGYWLLPDQKNSFTAFERALQCGFGIETDIRDAAGVAIISHDMPRGGELTLDCFLELCARYPQGRPLALNVKSDGLQGLIQEALHRHRITDAFVFDMAVPDAIEYLRRDIPTYTRSSEFEHPPPFLGQATGVWLDAFEGEWYSASTIKEWLEMDKAVCIVSPELHGRPHLPMWQQLSSWDIHRHAGLTLCTDFPNEAKDTFYDKLH